ncbi:MAG TPA: cyanophycinase [bacterium]|nr:cyanophycinase [bacterium]
MKYLRFLLLLFLFYFVMKCDHSPNNKGHLFIIGGGSRPDYMIEKIVELAGGKEARIMIIPNASGSPIEVAQYQQNQFEKTEAASVNYLLCDSSEADFDSNVVKLKDINCIFFSGGDQRRLTRDLLNTKLLKRIKEIYNQGGVISGTSAGAAVMSELMITGDELIDTTDDEKFISIKKDYIKTTPGFGFVKKAIIDQHFVKRKRLNRLISLVIEHQTLGLGIDESTAIHVKPNLECEVVGENTVLFFDGTKIQNKQTDSNGNLSAQNIQMDILQSGQCYNLKTNKVK